MAKFEKGNTEGRKRRGKKYPKDAKIKMQAVVEGYLDSSEMAADLSLMNPTDRFKSYISLAPYFLARKREITIEQMQDEFAEQLERKILNGL